MPSVNEHPQHISTIVIGDMVRWQEMDKSVPIIDGFTFLDVEDFMQNRAEVHKAGIILSPLTMRHHDAVDIAFCLQHTGYQGMYRVVVTDFDYPHLIIKEVNDMAPDIDFDILEL